MRLLVGQLFHEGNSFNPVNTTLEDFTVVRGPKILEQLSGTGSVLGGILDELQLRDVEIVPVLAACARPGGSVVHSVYESFSEELLEAAASGRPDHVVLDLHGAMTTTESDDPEGLLLERLRSILGPDAVMGIGLDLHAHLTERMLKATDIVTACKHNPHSDYHATGVKAADLVIRTAQQTIDPVLSVARVPMILEGNDETHAGPLKDLHDKARHYSEKNASVLDVSICNVQSLIDVPEMTQTVVATTDSCDDLGKTICAEIGFELWTRRHEFKDDFPTVERVLQQIQEQPGKRPYAISDFGDRVLAGAPGDCTEILAACLELNSGLRGAIPVTDPDAAALAQAAGIGAMVTLEVGGLFTPGAKRIPVTGRVRNIADGQFVLKGPWLAGHKASHGATAVIELDRLVLILTSRAAMSQDVNFFESLGVPIADQDFVVVKSGMHFQLSFEGVATPIKADTFGVGVYRPGQFAVRRELVFPEVDQDIGSISAEGIPDVRQRQEVRNAQPRAICMPLCAEQSVVGSKT